MSEAFEHFASCFTGYLDHHGDILIFVGARAISRLGVVELLQDAVGSLRRIHWDWKGEIIQTRSGIL